MTLGYKVIFLLLMIWLHIIDDYYLQGMLAKLKQRAWWEENAPDKLYTHDYKVALLEHSFSWTAAIMLPVMCAFMFKLLDIHIGCILVCFVCNMAAHAYIDDAKANKKKISLLTDQTIHILQIIFTWVECFIMFVG